VDCSVFGTVYPVVLICEKETGNLELFFSQYSQKLPLPVEDRVPKIRTISVSSIYMLACRFLVSFGRYRQYLFWFRFLSFVLYLVYFFMLYDLNHELYYSGPYIRNSRIFCRKKALIMVKEQISMKNSRPVWSFLSSLARPINNDDMDKLRCLFCLLFCLRALTLQIVRGVDLLCLHISPPGPWDREVSKLQD